MKRETSGAKAQNKKGLRCDGTTEVVPFPRPRALRKRTIPAAGGACL